MKAAAGLSVTERTSGSKMLKKARSFRDDIKVRIKRRPSTGVQQMIPSDKNVKGKSKADIPSGDEHDGDDVSCYVFVTSAIRDSRFCVTSTT